MDVLSDSMRRSGHVARFESSNAVASQAGNWMDAAAGEDANWYVSRALQAGGAIVCAAKRE